jgi:7-keto-8-aminopelargonate synthetase-like enzyme
MFSILTTPGRTAVTTQGEWLFFSGYSYLGIQKVPAIASAAAQAFEQFGWLYPSARISNTPLQIFEQTEAALSQLTGMPHTVLFNNGFAAGQAAIASMEPDSRLFCSPCCHPAIAAGSKFEGSFADWTRYCVQQINASGHSRPTYLLTDAVNPLTAEVFDFSFLTAINHPVVCIIDDSHGIGLLGQHGEGISSLLPRLPHVEYVITYSLSKAMHLPGGAIGCSQPNRAMALKNTSWFAATTPPSPAPLQVWLQHQPIYIEQLQLVRANAQYLRQKIGHLPGVGHHPQLPVFVLPPQLDAAFFSHYHMLISSFSYPNPAGTPLNRIVVSALHTHSDLDSVAAAVEAGIVKGRL